MTCKDGAVRVLDLFCGAGGASAGYARAFPGAEIVGVDNVEQPNYPHAFVLADAMEYPLDGFDVVHASPPCHDHSTVGGRRRNERGRFGTAWLLPATLNRLRALEVPWFVENVGGTRQLIAARAPYVFQLCGSSFGLDLRRHRLFGTNVPLAPPPCNHSWQTPRFTSLRWDNRRAGQLSPVVGVHGHCNYPGELDERRRAMDIAWMTNDELCEAIPPAYTEWIGRELSTPRQPRQARLFDMT